MTPFYDDGACVIYHGDCRDVLPTLEPVDLVLTDPPYGIEAGSAFWRRDGTAIEDWGEEGQNQVVSGWHDKAGPLVAEGGFLAEFIAGPLAAEAAAVEAHDRIGLTPWRRFLIVKTAPPPTVRPTFVSGYEHAVISYRGSRRWFGGGAIPDRWIGNTPNRLGNGTGHPTEKPAEAMRILVQALTTASALVLDPFMGSGTTLRAAKDLGRKAIGIEIEERWCELAARRLAQEVLPLGA